MPANLLDRRAFVAALASLPASRLLARQEPTFSTDVKVVNVFATVRDKKGQIVKDLKKEDFSLVEDGRPQVIKYFSQQSDLPLTLGLLVDTSRSERRMIPTERTASHKFFEQVLRPDRDKAFLLHFDREVELLQDLTASRERLEKALDLLEASDEQQQTDSRQDPNGNGGNGGGYPGGGGGWPGGGGNRGGGAPRTESGVDGKKIMQQIASRTGGQFFEAKKKDNLDDIYNQIAASLRQQYLLTYTPDKVDTDGEFHKIVLKTDKTDLNVITREGYYAPAPDK